MSKGPPTMEQLKRMRNWMEHMSKPGPKVVFRDKNGVETAQPYPEDGRQEAVKALKEINSMIAKREKAEA